MFSPNYFLVELRIHWRLIFGLTLQLIKKEALAQVFSGEFCEIFWNTFFTEYHQATASEYCRYILDGKPKNVPVETWKDEQLYKKFYPLRPARLLPSKFIC